MPKTSPKSSLTEMFDAPSGSAGCTFMVLRRSSSHICGISSAGVEGCSSIMIFDMPYPDSDVIL